MIETEQTENGLIVRVTGDINLATSPTLRTELMAILKNDQAKPGKLMVDLTEVSFMDSSGVATMVEALREQTAANSAMVLFGMQPRVKSIFEISRLDTLFTILEDQDAAEAHSA